MSAFNIKLKEEKSIWDAFVLTSPQRSIFVYSKFLDSLQVNYDLITCYEKGAVVAGVVLIYSDFNTPIIGAFPFTQYQGVLLANFSKKTAHSQVTHEFKVTEYLINQLSAHYNKLAFCNSWRLRDIRPFQWHNYHEPKNGQFKICLRYTGILDLQKFNNFEEYLTSVRTVRRHEFKKSSQFLRFEFSDDESLLDELHGRTFERQNLERTDQDSMLVRSICKHAITSGYGKMSIAYLDNIPVSAVLFLYDDRTAYYIFGANDPLYRNSGAGAFLLMQMIKDAFENGMEEVDFVGVNSPSRGDFKISFNAELKPYLMCTLEK